MSARFHGISSITLTGVAVAIAAAAALRTSWALALAYLVLCTVALVGILYAFCAKCPCQMRCAHVLPGRLAAAFTQRRSGPYSAAELAIVGTALLVLLGLPQFWLWRYTVPLIVFWVLNTVALAQIRVVVCRTCDNVHCPACVSGMGALDR
jgi:hypothetical protein